MDCLKLFATRYGIHNVCLKADKELSDSIPRKTKNKIDEQELKQKTDEWEKF